MSALDFSGEFFSWFFLSAFVGFVGCVYLLAWAAGNVERGRWKLLFSVIAGATFGVVLLLYWSEFSRVEILPSGAVAMYNPAGAPVGLFPPAAVLQVAAVDPSEQAGLSQGGSHEVITHRVSISANDKYVKSIDVPRKVRDSATVALTQRLTTRPRSLAQTSNWRDAWTLYLLEAAFVTLLLGWSLLEKQRRRVLRRGNDGRQGRRWVHGRLREPLEIAWSTRGARFTPGSVEIETMPEPAGDVASPYRTLAENVISVDLTSAVFPMPPEKKDLAATGAGLRLEAGSSIEMCGVLDGTRLLAGGAPVILVDPSTAPRARWLAILAEPLLRRRRAVGTLIRYAIPTLFLASLYL